MKKAPSSDNRAMLIKYMMLNGTKKVDIVLLFLAATLTSWNDGVFLCNLSICFVLFSMLSFFLNWRVNTYNCELMIMSKKRNQQPSRNHAPCSYKRSKHDALLWSIHLRTLRNDMNATKPSNTKGIIDIRNIPFEKYEFSLMVANKIIGCSRT